MRQNRPHSRHAAGQAEDDGRLVRLADIAALSHLAGTSFAMTAAPTGSDPALLHGRYLLTPLRSGVVLHATDARDLQDFSSQVVHGEGVTVSLFLEGHADVRIGRRDFRFGRGGEADAAVMVRTEPDLFVRNGHRGAHVRKVNITIPADWLEEGGLDALDRDGTVRRMSGDHLANLRWQPSRRLVGIAEQMLAAPAFTPFLRDLYFESRAMELLFEAFSTLGSGAMAPEPAHPRVKQRMWQVQDYLEERLAEELSLDQVAQAAGMSVTSLQRAFRAAFGVTVFEYVRRHRLERARDALVREGVSVTEAAGLAGYTSAANFSTAFRRAFGVPPKAMR